MVLFEGMKQAEAGMMEHTKYIESGSGRQVDHRKSSLSHIIDNYFRFSLLKLCY